MEKIFRYRGKLPYTTTKAVFDNDGNTVESRLADINNKMLSKTDLKAYAKKSDLNSFAKKSDVDGLINDIDNLLQTIIDA